MLWYIGESCVHVEDQIEKNIYFQVKGQATENKIKGVGIGEGSKIQKSEK